MYGMLMSNCGYTYEYVDHHMTIPKLVALNKYWSKLPPQSIMLAAIARAMGFDWAKKDSAEDEAAKLVELKGIAADMQRGAS